MTRFEDLSRQEQEEKLAELRKDYQEFQAKGLHLDMSRGKPGADQLDLTMPILDVLNSQSVMRAEKGEDLRNYGVLEGIHECRKLFGNLFGMNHETEVFIGGNSSLNLMYDCIARAMSFGFYNSPRPWCKEEKIKWLCPVPGYDRHFAITELFGFEMINIPMNQDGPDMDMVKELCENDPTVKGIWCVPMYSNPTGITYSDEVVRKFAALNPAAPDFKIMWDNAYCIHHLSDHPDHLLNLMDELRKTGHEDMMITFASTSKISFPGGGVAAMACSKANLDFIKKQISVQTIGYDKINQMRHVMFYKDLDGLQAHMEKHRAILEPKFEKVVTMLEERLGGLNVASWNKPNGGYFVSVDVMEGCAKRVVSLCKEAGVVPTGAGATYPYGKDPKDTNIRLAPTMPPVSELEQAMELFCLCVQIAALEKLTEN